MTAQVDNTKIPVGTRLCAMFLDHLFMTMIMMSFALPRFIKAIASDDEEFPGMMSLTRGNWSYLFIFGFSLYFCKDMIGGRSIAKRALKLQLVDNKTGEVAGSLKCLVRNLFCIIWFIEVFVAIRNTSRRIGDRVAGTRLVPFDPVSVPPRVTIKQALLSVVLSYGLWLAIMKLSPATSSSWNVDYVKTSYNERASKDLEKLLTDSLGAYLTPTVKIYDTIRSENRKYIYARLKLNEDYLEDENSSVYLDKITKQLIYSKFPMETIRGQIIFTYWSSNHSHSWRINISVKPHLKKK